MKKISLNRKSKASSVGSIIFTVLGIALSGLIIMMALSAFKDANIKMELDTICRGYLLQLESDGNLSDAEKNSLINDIKEDITSRTNEDGTPRFNIKSGTLEVTLVTGSYQENVSIEIKCEIMLYQSKYNGTFTLTPESDREYVEYYKKYTSTSKS